MMDQTTDTAAEIAKFRETYLELFGSMPALPGGRFDFSGDVAPDWLLLIERLRAHSFYSDVFDEKLTNLILFGMLLVEHNPAAEVHAVAARRAGASWQELHKVVELAAATKALWPANAGSAMLKTVREKEGKASPSR
jgi:4-carboxymuconolactone decarboxylase